ncbi:MAG: nuclear transport factor 2 family protein [Gammaproteobacteria bacterium]
MPDLKQLILPFVFFVGTVSTVPCLAAPTAANNSESAKQVLQREHQYSAALLHGDANLLASVLADTFVDTSESGVLRDKQQLLRSIAHQTPPASITETDRKIQIYGDAAVVTVRFDVKGMDQGKPYEFAGRATDVWIKRAGNWYCVAAHSSATQ